MKFRMSIDVVEHDDDDDEEEERRPVLAVGRQRQQERNERCRRQRQSNVDSFGCCVSSFPLVWILKKHSLLILLVLFLAVDNMIFLWEKYSLTMTTMTTTTTTCRLLNKRFMARYFIRTVNMIFVNKYRIRRPNNYERTGYKKYFWVVDYHRIMTISCMIYVLNYWL